MAEGIAAVGNSLALGLERIAIIAQNVANSTTSGYLRQVGFIESTYATELGEAVDGGRLKLSTLSSTKRGALKHTGNPLDVAISGEGYFEVSTEAGKAITRKGTFSIDRQGRLCLGEYVVSGLDGEIRLSGGEARIDHEGKIWEDEQYIGQLRVVVPAATAALSVHGEGVYQVSGLYSDSNVSVRQGFVESSNVVTGEEVIELMEVVRHFEMNQRVLKAYSELIEKSITAIGQM